MELLDVLSIVCPILARVLIPLSINLDMRARNLAERKKYTILAVIFPIIFGIVYAIKRKAMQKAFKVCQRCGTRAGAYDRNCPKCGNGLLLEYKNPKEKLLKTISIILCIVGVISYGAGQYLGGFEYFRDKAELLMGIEDPEEDEPELIYDDELHYDRNGIAYTGWINMKYYDKDNVEYHIQYSENDDLLVIDENGKSYSYEECRVDLDGNLLHSNEPLDGKTIFTLDEVYWDYSGQLHTIYE